MTNLSERYEEHHRARRDEGDFVFVPERIPLFRDAIGRGKRVLDLGCRSGALTRHFLDGNSVVGLDVDAAALEKAATLGIEPVQANVEDPLPFGDESFDAVVAGELFEHLQFPDALGDEDEVAFVPSLAMVRFVALAEIRHAEPTAASCPSEAIVLRRPSSNGISGAHPRICFARVMSGWRTCGSSTGSAS